MIGTNKGMKESNNKIKVEFNLKGFDVTEITAEIVKILNRSTEVEVLDHKNQS